MSGETINLMRSISTVLLLVVFLLIVADSFRRSKKRKFEQAANIPLEDDDRVPTVQNINPSK